MSKRVAETAILFVCLTVTFSPTQALSQGRMMPWNFGPDAERALKSNTDVLGKEILAQGEPSFEQVARYFPAMKRPRAIVGVKEHPDEIGVTWDGVLQMKHREISFHLGDPPSPYGLEAPPTRSLLAGYLPVVETRWQFDGLLYEETVFGYSQDLSPDKPLFAYVRFSVKNPRDAEQSARITVYSSPQEGGLIPSYTAKVPPHGEHDFYFKVPYETDLEHLTLPLEVADFSRALDETEKFWKNLLVHGMQVETPEARVNDGYRAWLMYNFLNVDKVEGTYKIPDGGGFYENVYGYSAALYCHALCLYGYWEEAEKYLDSMLLSQRPDGAYITVFGVPDNGALLFALGQHYRMSQHLDWFKKVSPQMMKSCEWISRNRATTKVLKNGTKPLTYGLLPPGPSYCDYQKPVYSYFSDTYNWLGMREAGLAFKEAGMVKEGEKWLKEADDYRNDIQASMEKATVDVGGIRALPVEPLTQRLLKQGGGDYYGLIATEILETGIFGPRDERASWITKYMEERGGLLLGLDRLWDGVDHAYTYGYAITQLRNGEVDKFLLTFYGFLAYGMSRGTYSAVEFTRLPYGINELTLPHTYSDTQQLRMLRMMLVREEGDDLLLASGTPEAWLEDGKTISVRRAPTPYGLLTYSLNPETAKREVKAIIEPLSASNERYPTRVKLWLRVPRDLGKLKKVLVSGKEWSSFHDDVIELNGSMLRGHLEIVAQY